MKQPLDILEESFEMFLQNARLKAKKEIIDDFKEKCYLQHMDGETRVVMEVEKFNQFMKEHLEEKH